MAARPVRIQLQEGDHVKACMLHAFASWPYFIVLVAFGVVGYAVHTTEQAPEDLRFAGLMVATVCGTIFVSRLFLTPLMISWNARRLFRESKQLHEPFDMTWDDEGATFAAATWNAKTAWSDYLKYRDAKDYVLLYINRASFRIIPKRAFPHDAARTDFERTVREKVGAIA